MHLDLPTTVVQSGTNSTVLEYGLVSLQIPAAIYSDSTLPQKHFG
jgi:hypothetical protein